MKNLLEDKSVVEMFEREKNKPTFDCGKIVDIKDGSLFKNSKFFQENPESTVQEIAEEYFINSMQSPINQRENLPSTSIMNRDENSSNSYNVGDQSRSLHPHSDMYISPSMTLSQCQEIAIKFARWYFQLLNSSMESDMTDWSPSHFWPDASAKVSLLSSSGESECVEVQQNAVEVSAMLVQVIRKHQLKFNPNMCEEGVRGKVSPHGLVIVLVCGTLHNQFTVCGVFEQVRSSWS